MGYLKETTADLAVKDRLWAATEREIMRYASDYADAAQKGEWSTERQSEIADAAKRKGYPKALVRYGSRLVRGTKAALRDLTDYRAAIGL